MRYHCEINACRKSYKHKRNLRRHIKERHSTVEFWNCVEENCSSRFIRRSYLSRHLAWTHGYGRPEAREAAISAPRGDNPTRHDDREDISDDDTILDLLAERNQTVNVQDFYDFIDDYDTDKLDDNNVTVQNAPDVDDILEGDVDVEVFEGANDEQVLNDDSNASDHARSVNNDEGGIVEDIQDASGNDNDGNDNDGDEMSDGDAVERDDDMEDAESVILISSDDEQYGDIDGTVAVDNSYTVVDVYVVTCIRRGRYVNGNVVNSVVSWEADAYRYAA